MVAASAAATQSCVGAGSNATPTTHGTATATKGPNSQPGERTFAVFLGGPRITTSGSGPVPPLDGPNGLDVDGNGWLFFAETAGHRIRRIEPDGVMTAFGSGTAGWRDGTSAEARFNRPYGVAVRRDASIIVADTGNHRIRLVTSTGVVTTLAGNGVPGSVDGDGTQATFHSPFSVAVTALDEVVVADTGNHRLRLIDRTGKVSTLAGSSVGFADGELSRAAFNGPTDVAIDRFGRIYVADIRNHAIRVVDLAHGKVLTLAGAPEAGDEDGEPSTARFRLPSGLAVDNLGNVYVADTGNSAVKRVESTGRTETVARTPGLGPSDVAVGPDGALYITDTTGHTVLRSR